MTQRNFWEVSLQFGGGVNPDSSSRGDCNYRDDDGFTDDGTIPDLSMNLSRCVGPDEPKVVHMWSNLLVFNAMQKWRENLPTPFEFIGPHKAGMSSLQHIQ
jgi:hypothetical protein